MWTVESENIVFGTTKYIYGDMQCTLPATYLQKQVSNQLPTNHGLVYELAVPPSTTRVDCFCS